MADYRMPCSAQCRHLFRKGLLSASGALVLAALAAGCTANASSPPPTSAASTGAGARGILSPATVPPSSSECTLPLTNDADGNVTPLLCPNGGVNTNAWRHYTSGPNGVTPKLLTLGRGATSTQVFSAMCSDYTSMYKTYPLTISAEKLAQAYYGWNVDQASLDSQLTARGCPSS